MSTHARLYWKLWIAAGLLIGATVVAYQPVRQFHRFFLTACAATGPERETELDIHPEPVDLARYYAQLRASGAGLIVRDLAQVEFAGEKWPILLFGPRDAVFEQSVLVVAGMHGNEVSGSLAALDILQTMRAQSAGPAIHVLAPANPIGLKYGSRYNAMGCDINRDFEAFRTIEARAIRSAIALVQPHFVVSLHEGPQAGAFVIGTRITSEAVLDAIVESMVSSNLPVASQDNLGFDLATPGQTIEGDFVTQAKKWLRIYSLGEHTSVLGIPLITTEAPWARTSMSERIAMHRVAVQVVVARMGSP